MNSIILFQLLLLLLLLLFQSSFQLIIDKKKHIDYTIQKYSISYNPYSLKIPSSELQILKDIYVQTNGVYWIWQNESLSGLKWNFDNNSNPCGFHNISGWQGISCTCSNQTEYHPYITEPVLFDDGAGLYYTYYDDIRFPFFSNQNCNINKLFLINFNMTGVMPSSMGYLTNLTHLHIVNNRIGGTIPTTFGLLSNLEIFIMGNNHFISGPIPNEFGNLQKLIRFDVEFNLLSSTLPSSMGRLSQLKYLFAGWNKLSGSIPSTYSNLLQLESFSLGVNKLSGSIPSSISKLSNLSAFAIGDNQLTNSIPSSLGLLHKLFFLDLSINSFTNKIPMELCNLVNIFIFSVNNNLLSGSINDCISNMNQLNTLWVQNNKLVGSLPSSIGFISTLQYIDLSNNKLTSSIPSTFSLLSNLVTLFVTNNRLIGNLNNVFNNSNQFFLTNVDVSTNYFTGTLPLSIFSIQSLNSFASVENCFQNTTLPINICTLANLQSLCLDGLHSSSTCRNNIFTNISSSYWPETYFTSDNIIVNVPSCLFNISSLKTLHLSGNGINVNLSNIFAISHSLQDLSLSNNAYTGTILSIIQNRKWKNLDLSFNRFEGIISPNIPSVSSGSSLHLSNNHLSGNIPHSLIIANHIDILTNNIFYCEPSWTVSRLLPSNDPEARIYICGTNRFYFAIILMVLTICIVIIYKVLFEIKDDYDGSEEENGIFYKFLDMIKKIQIRINENNFQYLVCAGEELDQLFNKNNNNSIFIMDESESNQCVSNVTELCNLAYGIWRCLFYIACLLLVVCLPISVILSQYYKTYFYSYGSVISTILLAGETPVIVFIVMIHSIMLFLYFILQWSIRHNFESKKENINENKDVNKNYSKLLFICIAMSTAVFINMLAMFSMNGLYVYSTLNLNGNIVSLIEIILALSKVLWKHGGLLFLLKFLKKKILKSNYIPNVVDESIIFQCIIGVFNNIFVPFIATALVNPNCFYNALIQQKSITSSYEYETCDEYNGESQVCIATSYSSRDTSYSPPFVYSYQCTSALIINYTVIYAYMAIFLIITYPIISRIFKLIYCHIEVNGTIYKYIDKYVSNSYKPLHVILESIDRNEVTNNNNHNAFNELNSDVNINPLQKKILDKPIFNQISFNVNIVSFLAIIVTIGVINPLLGILMCLCLSINLHTNLSVMGNHLKNSNIHQRKKLLYIYERDCKGVVNSIRLSTSILLPIMGLFYAPFIVDILGETNRLKSTLLPCLQMIFFPLELWFLKKIYNYYINFSNNGDKIQNTKVDRSISIENPLL